MSVRTSTTSEVNRGDLAVGFAARENRAKRDVEAAWGNLARKG